MTMAVPKEGFVGMVKDSVSSAPSESPLPLQPQFPDFTIPVKVSSFSFPLASLLSLVMFCCLMGKPMCDMMFLSVLLIQDFFKSREAREFLSGALAGAMTKAVLAPLETIRFLYTLNTCRLLL